MQAGIDASSLVIVCMSADYERERMAEFAFAASRGKALVFCNAGLPDYFPQSEQLLRVLGSAPWADARTSEAWASEAGERVLREQVSAALMATPLQLARSSCWWCPCFSGSPIPPAAVGRGAFAVVAAAAPATPATGGASAPLTARIGGVLLGDAEVEVPTPAMTPGKVERLLRSGGRDPAVAEAGARALVALTGGWGVKADRVAALRSAGVEYEVRCAECIACNAVETLLAGVLTHTPQVAPVEQCLVALRNIGGSLAGKGACVAAGVVGVAVRALVQSTVEEACHPGLAAAACGALRALAAHSPAGQAEALAAGAVPALVGALKKLVRTGTASGSGSGGSASPLTATGEACWVLHNIALSNAAGVHAIIEGGAVPPLVAALRLPSPPCVTAASWALTALMHDSAAGQNTATSAGAVPALVAALWAHASSAGVVEHVCGALSNLCAHNAAGKAACVSSGAVPAITAALLAHGREHAGVAEGGARALGNLTFKNTPAQEACVSAGVAARDNLTAVPALVEALEAQGATGVGIAEEACRALRNIACTAAGRVACVGAGGVQAIGRALGVHGVLVPAVAEQACRALCNITGYNPAGKEACVRHSGSGAAAVEGGGCGGVVEGIVAALAAHAASAPVAENACRALRSIAGIPSGKAACVAAGAAGALVAALDAHARAGAAAAEAPLAAAAEAAAAAVAAAAAPPSPFSCLPPSQEGEGHGGGGAAVLSAAALPPSSPSASKAFAASAAVVGCASGALGCIAALPTGADAAVEAGAVDALLAALKVYAHLEAVAEQACGALLNIGWANPANRAAMVDAGAVPLLAAAFRGHVGLARQMAHEALERLGFTDEGVRK
jgi:hypothetical protein